MVYVPGRSNNNNNYSNGSQQQGQGQQGQAYVTTATAMPMAAPAYGSGSGGHPPIAIPVGMPPSNQEFQQHPPPYASHHQHQQSPQYAPHHHQQQLHQQQAFPVSSSLGGGPTTNCGIRTSYPTDERKYGSGPTHGVISEGNPVKCHKIDYEIHGSEMQLVEIVLDPDEVVIAEAGAMMFLEDDVDFEAKLGDGSNPKQGFFGSLWSAGGRLFTGESLFVTHFRNRNPSLQRRVAFAAPYPGTIVPINMANFGQKIICQKDAFLCAALGTKLSIHFNKRLGAGLFGGEGFILQRLEGDGMAFIHAGGCIVKKELNGQRIRVDTGCLVAFTSGIDFQVALVKGLKSVLFGGEGLFLATLQGHGTVWLQSLPFSRMCDRIVRSAPALGGSNVGESTLFGSDVGNTMSGNGAGMDGGAIAGQIASGVFGQIFR